MKLKPPKNSNYAATVVKITNLNTLEGCDNVVATSIMGNQVIVSKHTKTGDVGLFFPVECALSNEYLSHNNLYRHNDLNEDKSKKGYFEDNGRIRCVKFRGHASEGLFMPISSVDKYITDPLHIGETFDELNGTTICSKYVVKVKNASGNNTGRKVDKKYKSKLVENQFRFHEDTEQLYRNLYKLHPNHIISITYKLHGTSVISSKILCKKPLKWYEKTLKYLGVDIIDTHYDYVYASRKVIKNAELVESSGYYDVDIWGLAHDKIKDRLQDGMTIYAEIVGFLPSGNYIQKDFDYDCAPNTFEVYVYRITYTNPSGKVFEFSAKQVHNYCTKVGLNAVPELYYGSAALWYEIYSGKTLEADMPLDAWRAEMLSLLKDTYNNKDCFMCANKVPEEGIVYRIESLDLEAYKLKSTRFLEYETKQLDKGNIDIESI